VVRLFRAVVLMLFFLPIFTAPPRFPRNILGCGAGSVERACKTRSLKSVGRVRHVPHAVRRRKTGRRQVSEKQGSGVRDQGSEKQRPGRNHEVSAWNQIGRMARSLAHRSQRRGWSPLPPTFLAKVLILHDLVLMAGSRSLNLNYLTSKVVRNQGLRHVFSRLRCFWSVGSARIFPLRIEKNFSGKIRQRETFSGKKDGRFEVCRNPLRSPQRRGPVAGDPDSGTPGTARPSFQKEKYQLRTSVAKREK
jgi:hypothetical protein